MTARIRIVLVDDNKDIHDAVKRLIDKVDDFQLVGQAFDAEVALKLCRVAKPDLVLMDVVLPEMNGAATTKAILRLLPKTKILALSSFSDYAYIRNMLESGAIGYLTKSDLTQDLVSTIRSTMQGNTILSPQAAKAIFSPEKSQTDTTDFGLTERELQVLKLMADGHTYDAITHELHISQSTVRFHVNNVLEKMGVKTRSEVLVLAAKNNLI
jgi:NarL family two-component system response regulator LiaR